MTSCLLIVGDDYWGRFAAGNFVQHPGVVVAKNASVGLGRMVRLLWRGSLPITSAMKMALSEYCRAPSHAEITHIVVNNSDIVSLSRQFGFSTVLLFRAGLIVSSRVLDNLEVLNIHCADLNSYGGLASIDRALSDEAFSQRATLHRVTNRIDDGEVYDTEAYTLDPRLSFRENEDRAYSAGIRLLKRTVDRLAGPAHRTSI